MYPGFLEFGSDALPILSLSYLALANVTGVVQQVLHGCDARSRQSLVE